MRDQANLLAQCLQPKLAQINPANGDAAGLRLDQPQQQMHEGAFAGAVDAGQRHRLASANSQLQAAEQRFAPGIGEVDLRIHDVANRRHQLLAAAIHFRARLQRIG